MKQAKNKQQDPDYECYYAAKQNDVATLKVFEQQDIDLCKIKWHGRSLLIYAALNNSKDVVKLLIDKKCDVNEADNAGYTPIHACAEYGFSEVGKLLLKAKADINAIDKEGNTPLFLAVFYVKDSLEMIELLVDKGADPLQKSPHGESPYAFAVRSGKDEVVAYFRRKGYKEP